MKRNDVVNMAKRIKSHDDVVNYYNDIKPLPVGYRLRFVDDWCASFVSVVLYKCGYKKICECSVPRMIELAKKCGIYKDKSYVPKVGDLVIYDWDDIKDGDHVGIITVKDNIGFLTVQEGNKAGAIGIRVIHYEDSCISGFISIPYDKEVTTPAKYKTVDDIVNAIIAGKFGNGEDRKEALYKFFQDKVNDKLK